jgi:hypothetical protein
VAFEEPNGSRTTLAHGGLGLAAVGLSSILRAQCVALSMTPDSDNRRDRWKHRIAALVASVISPSMVPHGYLDPS